MSRTDFAIIKLFIFTLLIVYSLSSAQAQLQSNNKNIPGMIFHPDALGIQNEFMLNNSFGIKLIGLYVYGLCVRENEYILTGAAAPVYHFKPLSSYLQPIIFGGIAYSYHHWSLSSETSTRSGVIHDLTVGGGAGLSFKITHHSHVGMNIWINYDYKTVRTEEEVKKGRRFFLPMIFLDYSYYF